MPFVSEKIIDRIVLKSENADFSLEDEIAIVAGGQPMLLSYLTHEQFDALTKEEQSLLLYLSWVIYSSVASANSELLMVTENEIGEAEEQNWELYLSNSSNDFHQQLDAFFDDTDQEDLLAFIEDALVDDDNEIVTEEGRALLFVGLKTVVDVLT